MSSSSTCFRRLDVVFNLPWTWIYCLFGLLCSMVSAGSNLPLLSGTLRTFQVHACDGHELKIECWPNTVINIYLAQYGRQVPSHQLCPPEGVTDGDLAMLNDTTDCLSTHALRTVEESCREQRICKVRTSALTFGHDPCPGVRKYAEVAYKCRPNVFSNKVVCEGDRLQLRCQGNLSIVIYSASFGATHYGVPECPQPHGEGHVEDCQVSYATEAVMSSCHGRRKCSIGADVGTFGKPGCPAGTRLFLKVVHTCVPKEILKDLGISSTNDDPEDSDYTGFIKEPRYMPPATVEPLMEAPTTPSTTKRPPTPTSIENKEKFILYLTLSMSGALLVLLSILATKFYTRRSRRRHQEAHKKPPIPDISSDVTGGISPFGDDCTELDHFDPPSRDSGVEGVPFSARSSFRRAVEDDDVSFPRAPVRAQNNYYYS